MKQIHYTQRDGFGLIAIIALVAMLIIGGTVAYEVSTKEAVYEVPTKTIDVVVSEDVPTKGTGTVTEQTVAVRAEILVKVQVLKERTVAVIEDIRLQLEPRGSAQISPTAFVNSFAEIKTDIAGVYVVADVESKAELTTLRAQIAQAETRLAGNSGAQSVSSAFADIAVDIKATLNLNSGVEVNRDYKECPDGMRTHFNEMTGEYGDCVSENYIGI